MVALLFTNTFRATRSGNPRSSSASLVRKCFFIFPEPIAENAALTPLFLYRSTVRCVSETCRIHEMQGEDFMAVVNSSPGTAAALRNMCRKRLFKKAVKQFSLQKNRGLSDEDIVAAFHDADLDKVRHCHEWVCLPSALRHSEHSLQMLQTGFLNVEKLRQLMHR